MRHYPKFGISSIVAMIVVLSACFVPVTGSVLAAPVIDSHRADTSSNYQSTPHISETNLSPTWAIPTAMSPSISKQDGGDFTTQAALSLTRAFQTSNFVASKAYHDISFRTATAGVIKSVVMDFPTGTGVGSAGVIEVTGIGPGTLAASAGEVLTYTVTNAVNVPANTIIRIQMANINNPTTPSASFTVSITTRDSAATPIDGPTPTFATNMVQVGNAQIAPDAVTTTKIANDAVTLAKIAPGSVATSWDIIQEVSDPVTVGGFSTNTVQVQCPSGYTASGPVYNSVTLNSGLVIEKQALVDIGGGQTAMETRVRNDENTANDFQGGVICFRLVGNP